MSTRLGFANQLGLANQKGFSLIEVLVAVLIVAVGVLGVAGLQIVTMRGNSLAMARTSANQLAYNIIDRVRGNFHDGFEDDYTVALGDDPPPDPDCEANDCTPQEMSYYDLNQWVADVRALPNGQGGVDINGNVIDVTIQWDDNAGVAQTIVVRTQLRG